MTTSTTQEQHLEPKITERLPDPDEKRSVQVSPTSSPLSSTNSSPVSSVASSRSSPHDEDVSRFTNLERKRLSLCQQRVRLERQLFEASHQVAADHAAAQEAEWPDMAADASSSQLDVSGLQASTSDLSFDTAGNNNEVRHVTNHLVRFAKGQGHWTGPLTPVLDEQDGTTVWKPNGRGTLNYTNGQVFEGQVVNGLRQGFGKNTWPDGQQYVGHWKQNSRAGRGSHMWPDSKTVTGQWTHGHLNGRCFFQWPDGATYDGDTLNGKKHGRGVHTWTDGKIYKGQYEGGFEHGFGTLTEADGLCRYRGNFRYGQRHGYGTQIWREKTYEGEWQYNAVSGKGKLSWKNGAVYKGEFAQGRYHGHGSFVDKSGRHYVGPWIQGQKEGMEGRETWNVEGKMMTYVGSFLHGRRHGFGQLTMDANLIYAGGWYKGKRCGRGIALEGDTPLHCGMWSQDKPVAAGAIATTVGLTEPSAPTSPSSVASSTNSFDSSPTTTTTIATVTRDDMDLFWTESDLPESRVADAEFFNATQRRRRREALPWDDSA
mmetsp:Transcript_9997/g.20678  ORF Transcript_9997/g.20678 Transcript_9997/m.20678 type:complete len:542 (-) Transcript_9997:140-1765(-)